MTTQSALPQRQIDDYSHIEPLPDPPRKIDMWQRNILSAIDGVLIAHYAGRDEDVLVGGEGYLRRDADDTGDFVPDCVVTRDVRDSYAIIRRNGYVISEVGKPPDFILEVASRSTGRRDYTVKREGYADYGVREYWQFDPTGGEYHDAPLAGDLLVDGKYVPMEIVTEPDGRHWGYSEALELELWWENSGKDEGEDGVLRFRNPVTGEFLPTVEEWREAAETERESAVEWREAAETERAARRTAEARLAEMEAELRRLRGEP